MNKDKKKLSELLEEDLENMHALFEEQISSSEFSKRDWELLRKVPSQLMKEFVTESLKQNAKFQWLYGEKFKTLTSKPTIKPTYPVVFASDFTPGIEPIFKSNYQRRVTTDSSTPIGKILKDLKNDT